MTEHDVALATSLALHREVALRLKADPAVLAHAQARVAAWGESVHEHYRTAWEHLLAGSLDELCAVLTDDSERARDLRQVSPFAGALDSATRWQIWRSVRGR